MNDVSARPAEAGQQKPRQPSPFRTAARIVLALCLSLVGGFIFQRIGMPLPWMLGPMAANMIAALLGAPVYAPTAVRPYVVVVIGVMLGSGFTPAILDNIGSWLLSLVFVVIYLVVCALLIVPYYRRIGGFDDASAYFSGMPGGLNEMMIIGGEMGGDDRKIILAHTIRIFMTVCLIALWYRLFSGLPPVDREGVGIGFLDIPPPELVLLALAGALGFVLGRALRLPAPTLMGPMLVSALLHITHVVTSPPPHELVIGAQFLLGTIVGCRFVGMQPGEVLRAMLLGFGATLIMIVLTVMFAAALQGPLGFEMHQILLAFAPGGLTEMSLVALAMDADVAYIATHHMTRIVLVVLIAPLAFTWMRRWQGG